MSAPISYDPEDLVYLDQTDGLRVTPRGTIHHASCRVLAPTLGPVPVLPWPKYADEDDRPCKVCAPAVPTPTVPVSRESEENHDG